MVPVLEEKGRVLSTEKTWSSSSHGHCHFHCHCHHCTQTASHCAHFFAASCCVNIAAKKVKQKFGSHSWQTDRQIKFVGWHKVALNEDKKEAKSKRKVAKLTFCRFFSSLCHQLSRLSSPLLFPSLSILDYVLHSALPIFFFFSTINTDTFCILNWCQKTISIMENKSWNTSLLARKCTNHMKHTQKTNIIFTYQWI